MDGPAHERTLTTHRAFDGRLLKVDVLDVELEDGRTSTREVIRHPGAVVVLVQLPDERFVFVRQFRTAIDRTLLEAVAGTLEPGEEPEFCARREVQEETGHTVTDITPLGIIVPAPGYTDERLHAYVARVSPEAKPLDTDEDEHIEVCYYTEEEFCATFTTESVLDAKTIATWHLFTRDRVAGNDERTEA